MISSRIATLLLLASSAAFAFVSADPTYGKYPAVEQYSSRTYEDEPASYGEYPAQPPSDYSMADGGYSTDSYGEDDDEYPIDNGSVYQHVNDGSYSAPTTYRYDAYSSTTLNMYSSRPDNYDQGYSQGQTSYAPRYMPYSAPASKETYVVKEEHHMVPVSYGGGSEQHNDAPKDAHRDTPPSQGPASGGPSANLPPINRDANGNPIATLPANGSTPVSNTPAGGTGGPSGSTGPGNGDTQTAPAPALLHLNTNSSDQWQNATTTTTTS